MESTTINTQAFKLLEGEFSTFEAKEILIHLIKQEINLHHIRDWSSQERYGKRDEFSVQKINELKETRNSILEIIQSAKEEGLSLKINTNISIELI